MKNLLEKAVEEGRKVTVIFKSPTNDGATNRTLPIVAFDEMGICLDAYGYQQLIHWSNIQEILL